MLLDPDLSLSLKKNDLSLFALILVFYIKSFTSITLSRLLRLLLFRIFINMFNLSKKKQLKFLINLKSDI